MLTSPRTDVIRDHVPGSTLANQAANHKSHLQHNVRFVNANVCRISSHQNPKIRIAYVTFIAEQTDMPGLICFVKCSVDMEYINLKAASRLTYVSNCCKSVAIDVLSCKISQHFCVIVPYEFGHTSQPLRNILPLCWAKYSVHDLLLRELDCGTS